MKKSNHAILINILSSIFLVLVTLSLAVLIGPNLRFIYLLDIDAYQLDAMGFARPTVVSTYHQLIDYLLPFYFHSFPITDPALVSASGISHFEEVKVIFNVIYLAGLLSAVGLGVLTYFNIKKRSFDFRYFKYTFLVYLTLVGTITLCILVDFSATFTAFHELMFNNDDWIFDDSPIIFLLPEVFFMQMALVIGGFMLSISGLGWLSVTLIRQRCAKKAPGVKKQ